MRALLYEAHTDAHSVVFQPSELWRETRLSSKGDVTIRELVRQLLEAVNECHEKNVTHRDIKPENLLVPPPILCTHACGWIHGRRASRLKTCCSLPRRGDQVIHTQNSF